MQALHGWVGGRIGSNYTYMMDGGGLVILFRIKLGGVKEMCRRGREKGWKGEDKESVNRIDSGVDVWINEVVVETRGVILTAK